MQARSHAHGSESELPAGHCARSSRGVDCQSQLSRHAVIGSHKTGHEYRRICDARSTYILPTYERLAGLHRESLGTQADWQRRGARCGESESRDTYSCITCSFGREPGISRVCSLFHSGVACKLRGRPRLACIIGLCGRHVSRPFGSQPGGISHAHLDNRFVTGRLSSQARRSCIACLRCRRGGGACRRRRAFDRGRGILKHIGTQGIHLRHEGSLCSHARERLGLEIRWRVRWLRRRRHGSDDGRGNDVSHVSPSSSSSESE